MNKELEESIEKYKDALANSPRKHWKVDKTTGRYINVFLKFYLNGRYLGAGYVTEGSWREHRRELARRLGITYYNGLVFGNRDMRNMKVVTKQGKTRKDIDFIHPSDFPKSHFLSDVEPISKRQLKKRRNAIK